MSTVPIATASTSATAHTSAEGTHHHDGTASSGFLSRLEGLSLNVKQPRYDWDAPDQHQEFRVFCNQLTSWFNLRLIRNFQACDAILCCLGKKGYDILDEWIADDVMREDWQASLCHFETTLDTEVGPHVHIYDLEAIRKKHDETAHELVARICQLAS